MKRRIFSVFFALVLVLSMSLVTAVPAAAQPVDPTGACTVTPLQVVPSSTGNELTFIFATGDDMSGGAISITAPANWSAPQGSKGTAGYTTATSSGDIGELEFSSQTVIVPIITTAREGTIIVVYGDGGGASGATAQDTEETVEFTTESDVDGNKVFQPLPDELQPKVTVGVVALDAPYYEPGDTVTVTVTDADANTHPTGIDTVEVTATNTLTDKVEGIGLEETDVNTGIFTGIFGTSAVYPAPEGQLYVEDYEEFDAGEVIPESIVNDTITVTYSNGHTATARVNNDWPEVSMELPAEVTNNDLEYADAECSLTNPLEGLGYASAIFAITFDASAALEAGDVVVGQTPDEYVIPFVEVGGNLVGYWGSPVSPEDIPAGVLDFPTTFRVKIVDGPLGTYTITVDLLDLGFPEEGGVAYHGGIERHVLASVSDTTEVIALVPPTLSVDITAPADSANMSKGQTFGVEAVVINTGPVAATSVTATIEVTGNATASEPLTKPAEPAELAVGGSTEVSWTVTCNDVGAVTIEVTPDGKYTAAGTPTPIPEAKLIPDSIGVNQQLPAALKVTDVTAPDTVKVGREFDVSATVKNTGGATAAAVTATIGVTGEASLKTGETATKPKLALVLAAGESGVISWTVTCTALGEAHITVTAAGKDANSEDSISDSKGKSATVAQTEAAVLKVTISWPGDDDYYNIGDEFDVDATVKNTGFSTAKDVTLTLAIDAYAELKTGEVATQQIGYLAPAHTSDTITWTLVCTAAGKSKITVSPEGNDVLTGVAIPAGSLIADSVTVLQSITSYDFYLYEGWNLISLPLIPFDSSIETVLADLITADTVIQVRAYNAISGTWGIWASTGPYALNPTLTEMNDGRGFWINMSTGDNLVAIGSVLPPPPETPPTYSVYEGWNLIGFTSLEDLPAGLYLGSAVAKTVEVMYRYNAELSLYEWVVIIDPDILFEDPEWFEFLSIEIFGEENCELVAGEGYWLAVSADGTIYP